MTQTFIPLAIPNIGDAENAAVDNALRSGFVSSVGPAVEEFESAFAQTVGSQYAVACASGTAAIHIALLLLGVDSGDEVFCSDFTFAGSGNPIAYLKAVPVFVDSELTTWNLDPQRIADELHHRARLGRPMPAAIEVVHVLGQPAQLDAILEVSRKYEIPIIEDAAEALGSGWSAGALAGRTTGTVGEIGCFSFNGNKIVTSGGGGMIVTDDAALAARARHLTTQAKVPDVGYLHDEIGYNYRLTNLAAALGNAQLNRLEEFLTSKLKNAAYYDEQLGELPVTLPPRVEGYDSSYWLYSILAADHAERDHLLQHLSNSGVGARALWRPLSTQPAYAGSSTLGSATNASQLFERGLSLPSSTQLSTEERTHVAEAVRSFYASC